MTDRSKAPPLLSRREAAGGLLATVGGAFLFGCGASSAEGAGSSGTSGTSGSSGTSGAWASGGTASMKGGYADPFPVAGAACVLMASATEGPCTEAADQVRRDISEGLAGLPMRLALRVVDSSCKPIAGATVKIWHTSIAGSYSGDTPNNAMCLKSQADSAKHYFRGVQTTDASGRVDFDSCFPGWYRGRTIHIHYTVTAGNRSFTSQLVFDQTLVADIFATHDAYKPYGQPDTTNASDNVVGRGNLASYTLVTSRLADGAMMAAKEIQIA